MFVWTASSHLWQTALAMCFYPLAAHFLCVTSSDHQTLINQPETPGHPLTSSRVVIVTDIWLRHQGRLCVCAIFECRKHLCTAVCVNHPRSSYPLPSRGCSIQASRLLLHSQKERVRDVWRVSNWGLFVICQWLLCDQST